MDSQTEPSMEPSEGEGWRSKALSLEWLGQTIASLCWISSVFVYGISSAGDWLQLIAGVAWLVANVSSLNRA